MATKQSPKKFYERSSSEVVTVENSRINGRGIFARMILPSRQKLGEITGQLVKMPQAKKAVENLPKIFFVELSDRWALDCSTGNEFKHINHSCEPNCYLRISHQKVEVYSLKKISKGTELTVDYGLTPHKQGMKCSCGKLKCRGKI